MPRAFVVGNWKMNTTPAEAADLASAVRRGFDAAGGVEVVLCPPFVSLATVREAVGDSGVRVGAQNMYFETSGAFTGEVSPAMLSGLCDYVILGHSERRQLFGETDESVNRKVHSAIAAELRPILCVGETLEQREQGQAADIIAAQVRVGLRDLVDISSVLVAYEPVWAIGTGLAATPEIANEIMGGAIQETLRSLVGEAGGSVPLLYGGSVNPGNVASYVSQSCVHGALVGGASLQAEQFLEVVRATATATANG